MEAIKKTTEKKQYMSPVSSHVYVGGLRRQWSGFDAQLYMYEVSIGLKWQSSTCKEWNVGQCLYVELGPIYNFST